MKNGIIVFLILLLCGCASHGPVFREKVNKMEVTIPFESFSISVSDLRDYVSDNDIFLNPITFGGEQDFVSPPVPDNLESELKSIINEAKIKGDRSIKFEVEIKKGVQTFHFNGFHEVEYVEVILNIKALDNETEELIGQTTSKSWGKKKTFDATYKRINRMYLTAFRHAFKSGLKELKYKN
ncbi:hypothetical protein GSB9_01954 [Flavobacteriaceae bacterium GSB9]|nr:hypothetical protein GSB9_01954 [Flavobacteriaceae bacterium GSB9]